MIIIERSTAFKVFPAVSSLRKQIVLVDQWEDTLDRVEVEGDILSHRVEEPVAAQGSGGGDHPLCVCVCREVVAGWRESLA